MMNLKTCYGILLSVITKFAGADIAKKFDARFRFHRKLDLKNPKTLADKVSYLELHKQSPLASVCTDKYAVRDYVKGKGYENILVPLAGGPWNTPEEIDFNVLPERLVFKATHGCKMNYFVPDRSRIDMEKCMTEMKRWMSTTYGTYSLEPHYLTIPHRIYAEHFLDMQENLKDYKFHCLNGKPEFVIVFSDRHSDGDKAMRVTLDLYDMDWRPIYGLQRAGQEVPGNWDQKKPELFEKMKEIAAVLSDGIDFVRIDLYELNGKIYFGEMTFSPACCVFAYMTDEFITEMGKRLII